MSLEKGISRIGHFIGIITGIFLGIFFGLLAVDNDSLWLIIVCGIIGFLIAWGIIWLLTLGVMLINSYIQEIVYTAKIVDGTLVVNR